MRKICLRIILFCLIVMGVGAAFACEKEAPEKPANSRDLLKFTPAAPGKQVLTSKGASPQILITNYNETATDALGRKLPGSEETGLPKEGKYVGLFYSLWTVGSTCDVDVAKALASNPNNPNYGPRWGFCWWSEPETGYHRADDVWQIKRDMYYFAMAGVDFLYFDMTNGYLYEEAMKVFLDTCLELRAGGLMTPYVVPWCFGSAREGVGDTGKFYEEFMTDEKYADMWFYWDGRPLALIKPLDDGSFPILEDERFKDKLTFRKSWVSPENFSELYWEDNRIVNFGYGYGWVENRDVAECTGIGCAGFANFGAGRSGKLSAKKYLDPFLETGTMGEGLVFENAFKQLMERNPECQVLLISRWNEWVAQNFTQEHHTDTGYVDQFNPEFSRDIEPMKGGFTDNYFYQMCSIIRRFKGVLPPDGASGANTMDPADLEVFGRWETVLPVYTDFEGDTSRRDHQDTTGRRRYINDTGRNDITEARVTADGANVYFYVRTAADITPYAESPNWMLLFIDADCNKSTGWEGYDYLVNYEVLSDKLTTLCAYRDGVWQEAGNVSYAVRGNELTLAVPRSVLGLTDQTVVLGFHWLDNVSDVYSLESWFTTGDSAPERRNDYAAYIIVRYKEGGQVLPARDNGIAGMRGLSFSAEAEKRLKSGLEVSRYKLPKNYPAQPDFRLIESRYTDTVPSAGITADELSENGRLGAVFEGYVKVEPSRRYDFELSYKGGVKLYIDGRLIADGSYDPDLEPGVRTVSGGIILESGYHKIRAEYVQCLEEKPEISLKGDWELYYMDGSSEDANVWKVDFSKLKDQEAYTPDGSAAGIFEPYIYLKYGLTAYLGKVDLSKYSRVEIMYCCDGSAVTKERFENSSSLAIGLKSENSTYGQDNTDNFNGDIAHTDMVFSEYSWAGGARSAVIDLTDIKYDGDVWLALHNPAGTFIAILEICFYS